MKAWYIVAGAVALGAAYFLFRSGPTVVTYANGNPIRVPVPATGPAVETKSGRGHF
jgi:hypothetical protein